MAPSYKNLIGGDFMAFSQMLEILKNKERGTVVFVKLGTFYVAVGEDAVLMHKILDLKCTCFKMNICKVGFPVVALEKYIEKLNQTKYAYVIYDFNSEKAELIEVIRKKGKYNKEVEKSINCLICSGEINKRYSKEDKYVLALTKMLEKERRVSKIKFKFIYDRYYKLAKNKDYAESKNKCIGEAR